MRCACSSRGMGASRGFRFCFSSVSSLSRAVLCTWPCQCPRGLMRLRLELQLRVRASCSSLDALLSMFFSRCSSLDVLLLIPMSPSRVRVQGARAGRDPRQDLLEAPGALQGTPLPLVCPLAASPACCFLSFSISFHSSHSLLRSVLSRTLHCLAT